MASTIDPARKYLDGIYEMDATSIIRRLDDLFTGIMDKGYFASETLDPELACISSTHEMLVSAVHLAAAYLAPLLGKEPSSIPLRPKLGTLLLCKETMMERVAETIDLINAARIIISTASIASFGELHGGSPSDDKIALDRELRERSEKIPAVLAMASDVARSLVKME